MSQDFSKKTSLPFRKLHVPEETIRRNQLIGGPLPQVKFITIHNTAEPFSAVSEQDRVAGREAGKPVSFHYAVDEREAVELIAPVFACHHAGDGSGSGNAASLAIEICRSACREERPGLYEAAESNGVLLAAYLLAHYGLPLSALKKHQDWSGKFCPHRILENDAWNAFVGRVGEAMVSPAELIPGEGSGAAELGAMLVPGDPSWCIALNGGLRFQDCASLKAALPAGTVLLVSAWEEREPAFWRSLLKALRAAGIKISGFYVPVTGASPWLRQDISHFAEGALV